LPRWEYFFENDCQSPEEGWFIMERKWSLNNTLKYTNEAKGNTKKVLSKIWKKYRLMTNG
jgi:hypothetical protein